MAEERLAVHTSNTDGEEPPQRVISRYEEAGWDVVFVTDHWAITEQASTRGMLTIAGRSSKPSSPSGGGRTCHVLALGVATIPDGPAVRGRGSFADLNSAAAWIHSKGGVAFLAHPYCSGVEPQTFLDAHDVLGIEVFNAGYEIESGCGHAEWFRDAALGAGRPCLTIATDDSHEGPDCLNAWTMVRAAERSREGVVEALRKGRFYASAGPTIYDARRRGIRSRCTPSGAICSTADHSPLLDERFDRVPEPERPRLEDRLPRDSSPKPE